MISVIFSHYGQYFLGDSPLNQLGAIGCAIFFFVSGYGLSCKTNENGSYYMKKIISLYSTFILANSFFVIIELINGIEYSCVKLILSIIGYNHVFVCDWFIFVLIYFYLTLMLCKIMKVKNYSIICLFVGIAYTLHTMHFNCLSWILFPVGLIYSRFKYKENRLFAYVSLAFFLLAFVQQSLNNGLCDNTWRKITFILEMCSISTLCYYFGKETVFLTPKEVNNWGGDLSSLAKVIYGYTTKIGKNSLYFFLMQGLYFMIFTKLIILPALLNIFLLFPICLLLAIVFKKVDIRFHNILDRFILKKITSL